jgi:hypothetical protein
MLDNSHIQSFVQQTLGCACPEETFQSIERREAVRLDEDLVVTTALTIGNRLLVYVVGSFPKKDVQQQLDVLVTAGKEERDARGLNRFRLVVFTDDRVLEKQLRDVFELLRGADEKAHLHVLSAEKNIF